MDVGVFFVGMGAAAALGIVLLIAARSLTYCFGKPSLGFRLQPLAHGLLFQCAAMFALLFVFSPAHDLRYDAPATLAMVLLSNVAGWLGMRFAARA